MNRERANSSMRTRSLVIALLFLSSAIVSWALPSSAGEDQKKLLAVPEQGMTHEEEVVRNTYNKISFTARIGLLWNTLALGHLHRPNWPTVNDPIDTRSRWILDELTGKQENDLGKY
jgi:hypothetical protein